MVPLRIRWYTHYRFTLLVGFARLTFAVYSPLPAADVEVVELVGSGNEGRSTEIDLEPESSELISLGKYPVSRQILHSEHTQHSPRSLAHCARNGTQP